MDNFPFFSVIIPVFNAEKTIRKSVTSVLEQSFDDYELILINDGSKDNSRTIMESLRNSDTRHRIRLLDQDNGGAGNARNIGISYATGEYVAFLDADDYWDKTFLEETKRIIEEKVSDLVFIDIVRENEDGEFLRFEKMSSNSGLDKELIIRKQLTGCIPWGGVRKIVKHSLLTENGIVYDTSVKVGEECLYSYKALYYASSFSFQSKALYHYVDHENSLTSNDTVGNSIGVYELIHNSLERSDIHSKYESTVKALAITTMAVVTNLLSQHYGVYEACKRCKVLYSRYKNEYKGMIDFKSLERRVKFCVPWIKFQMAFPIVIAAKILCFFRSKLR